ncbi:MAG: hypothetical protein J0G32_05745 [Alphaproteobacteria bacterium]|nr:hypothetical protein [Alphaproteobacteria bacterium]OJV17120.1 MAG: hypothetical protein BGO27_06035 [Alphaproteobacteria bacterium 33-17]
MPNSQNTTLGKASSFFKKASEYALNLLKSGYPLLIGVVFSVFVPIYIAIPLLVIASFFTGYNIVSSTRSEVYSEIGNSYEAGIITSDTRHQPYVKVSSALQNNMNPSGSKPKILEIIEKLEEYNQKHQTPFIISNLEILTSAKNDNSYLKIEQAKEAMQQLLLANIPSDIKTSINQYLQSSPSRVKN